MITKKDFEEKIMKLIENKYFDEFVIYLSEILNNPDYKVRKLIDKFTDEWINLKKAPYLNIMDENQIKVSYSFFLKDNLPKFLAEISDEKLIEFHISKVEENEIIEEIEDDLIHQKVSFLRRIAAIMIDLVLISTFFILYFYFSHKWIFKFHIVFEGFDFLLKVPWNLIFISIILFLILNKDFKRGQSLGKKLMKLQIVDNKTYKSSSPVKCVIRNFFFLLFPLELILTIKQPSQQFADKKLNTLIVNYSTKNNAKFSIAYYLVSYLTTIIYIFIFQILIFIFIKLFQYKEDVNAIIEIFYLMKK
jgi:uncharacterized RDD family membrane protein YckC